MFCDAQGGKCKDTARIWGITNADESRLHRLTFSHSLAQMIADKRPGLKLKRFKFIIGKPLAPGEKSSSGLYALMAKKGDYALRISLIHDLAQMHAEDASRYLAQAWLIAE